MHWSEPTGRGHKGDKEEVPAIPLASHRRAGRGNATEAQMIGETRYRELHTLCSASTAQLKLIRRGTGRDNASPCDATNMTEKGAYYVEVAQVELKVAEMVELRVIPATIIECPTIPSAQVRKALLY